MSGRFAAAVKFEPEVQAVEPPAALVSGSHKPAESLADAWFDIEIPPLPDSVAPVAQVAQESTVQSAIESAPTGKPTEPDVEAIKPKSSGFSSSPIKAKAVPVVEPVRPARTAPVGASVNALTGAIIELSKEGSLEYRNSGKTKEAWLGEIMASSIDIAYTVIDKGARAGLNWSPGERSRAQRLLMGSISTVLASNITQMADPGFKHVARLYEAATDACLKPEYEGFGAESQQTFDDRASVVATSINASQKLASALSGSLPLGISYEPVAHEAVRWLMTRSKTLCNRLTSEMDAAGRRASFQATVDNLGTIWADTAVKVIEEKLNTARAIADPRASRAALDNLESGAFVKEINASADRKMDLLHQLTQTVLTTLVVDAIPSGPALSEAPVARQRAADPVPPPMNTMPPLEESTPAPISQMTI